MVILQLALILAASLSSTVQVGLTRGCCNDGWMSFRGSCYLFADNEKRDWTESVQQCGVHGAQLVTIETREEDLFLRDHLESVFRNAADRSHSYSWVGGSDVEVEDMWKWYTESSPMTYTNWYPGEPNGRQGSNCITLWGAHNFAWADDPCSDTRCISKHGHCQDDTISCNGVYQSNLCSGSVSRRCCVPASSGSACSKVNIISRSTWNARSPKSTNHLDTPVDLFFIHHTEGHACTSISSCSSTMRGIQSWHMNGRGWSDIGYSFLAGDDGNIYEGRGWNRQGAHTQGYNSRSLAVSFMGNYMNHLPPAAAITAVKNLIACGIESGKITSNYRLYGHRDAGSTSCPGNALYALIQTWPHYSTVKL